MTPTPKQIRQLRSLYAFRAAPPTLLGYARRAWRSHALLLIVGFSGGAMFLQADWAAAATLAPGLTLGAILRDFAWFRRIVRQWPLSDQITDWDRVRQLLETAALQP